MKRNLLVIIVVAISAACAHKGVTREDILSTLLGDLHNLNVVGCYQDDTGTLRALYLKETAASAGCFSVHFGPDGEIPELRAIPCGILNDELMNSNCELTDR